MLIFPDVLLPVNKVDLEIFNGALVSSIPSESVEQETKAVALKRMMAGRVKFFICRDLMNVELITINRHFKYAMFYPAKQTH
jgi:hypothetical protein